MGDAGGPGSARKCPGVALAHLGDTEGFEKGGEEGQLYAFKLSDGVYKRKKVTTQEGGGAQKLGELSDVDVSYAVLRRLHQLAFTGSMWVAFADPVQETGWMIDIRISSPYVATGQHHKVRKVTNSGTWMCFYVPETKKRGHFRAVHAENEQQPGGDSKNGIRVLFSGNHRRGKRAHINNPPRGDPRRPARRLRRRFARLQAQVDQRARAKRTWGLDQSSGATSGALYIGGGPARSGAPLSGYQQYPCWSGRAQKAEVHARRPRPRAKLGGLSHLNLPDSDDS